MKPEVLGLSDRHFYHLTYQKKGPKSYHPVNQKNSPVISRNNKKLLKEERETIKQKRGGDLSKTRSPYDVVVRERKFNAK